MRWLGVLALVVGSVGSAFAVSMETLLGGGRLVIYAPRDPSASAPPSPRTLRTDAERLSALGFRAVATSATPRALAPLCRVFKRHGFRTVLVGVGDPRDPAERRRAVHLRRCADAYVVGGAALAAGRDQLVRAMAGLRAASGRPVAARASWEALRDDATLRRAGDWLFPTIQPWEAGKRDAQDACGWTIAAYRELAQQAPAGVPVIAETGLPTEGAVGTSEHSQRAYLSCLESRQVALAFFEAFDRSADGEGGVAGHWGLFRADGSPKLWAAQQLRPALEATRSGADVRGRVSGAPIDALRIVVYVQEGDRWAVRPPIAPDRRGAWRLAAAPGQAVHLYVASAAWTPPPAPDRLPRVDRLYVLAERELGPE